MASVTGQAVRSVGKNADGTGRDSLLSRVRTMSGIEAAWVGAILDGEGCLVKDLREDRNYMRWTVGNTEPELISTLLRATGVGTVLSPKQKKSHHRPFFVWNVSRRNEVLDIARQCVPYSLKAQVAVAWWDHGI